MKEEFDMCSVEKWELQHDYSSEVWSKSYKIKNLKNEELGGFVRLLLGGAFLYATHQTYLEGGENYVLGIWMGLIISGLFLWSGIPAFRDYIQRWEEIAEERNNINKEIDDIIDKCNELELGITRQNHRDFMNREKSGRKLIRHSEYMDTYLNYVYSNDCENAPQYIKDWWAFRLEQHETPEHIDRVSRFWELNQ